MTEVEVSFTCPECESENTGYAVIELSSAHNAATVDCGECDCVLMVIIETKHDVTYTELVEDGDNE